MRCGVEADPSGFPRIKSNEVNNNTLVGSNSGREIKTGDNNTYIGYSAGRGVTNPENTSK